jgi:hypothetical protein
VLQQEASCTVGLAISGRTRYVVVLRQAWDSLKLAEPQGWETEQIGA